MVAYRANGFIRSETQILGIISSFAPLSQNKKVPITFSRL